MEGSGGGGGSRAVDAAHWIRDTAYRLGCIHTYAFCGLGVALRDTIHKNGAITSSKVCVKSTHMSSLNKCLETRRH